MRCRSGSRCKVDAEPGSKWCQAHGEQLARVRESMSRGDGTASRQTQSRLKRLRQERHQRYTSDLAAWRARRLGELVHEGLTSNRACAAEIGGSMGAVWYSKARAEAIAQGWVRQVPAARVGTALAPGVVKPEPAGERPTDPDLPVPATAEGR